MDPANLQKLVQLVMSNPDQFASLLNASNPTSSQPAPPPVLPHPHQHLIDPNRPVTVKPTINYYNRQQDTQQEVQPNPQIEQPAPQQDTGFIPVPEQPSPAVEGASTQADGPINIPLERMSQDLADELSRLAHDPEKPWNIITPETILTQQVLRNQRQLFEIIGSLSTQLTTLSKNLSSITLLLQRMVEKEQRDASFKELTFAAPVKEEPINGTTEDDNTEEPETEQPTRKPTKRVRSSSRKTTTRRKNAKKQR